MKNKKIVEKTKNEKTGNNIIGRRQNKRTGQAATLKEEMMTRDECLEIVKSASEKGENPYLREADLRWADLSGVDLRGANLLKANLREANLSGVDLREANLGGVDLRGANLLKANLREAYLREAYLRGAYLRWADLRWADLRWADLREANLRGADLRGANIDFACWPLWCGSDKVTIDDSIARQLFAHVLAVASEWIKPTTEQVEFANGFHRITSGEFPVIK